MTRRRLRLLSVLLLAGSIASCVGTGFVPTRRADGLGDAAWGLLFGVGLTLLVTAYFAFAAGARRPRAAGRLGAHGGVSAVHGGIGGLVTGAGIGLELGGGGLAAVVAALAFGCAAAGALWFRDLLNGLDLDDEGEPGDEGAPNR